MILALDFDGVLHPIKTTTEPKFCRLEMLETWLRGHPDVNVVISSSWREVYPFDLLQSLFADDLQVRIVGTTPVVLKAYEGPGARQVEIESWVSAGDEPSQPWLALDDDPTLFEAPCPWAVFCDPRQGIDQQALLRLSAAFDAATAHDRWIREQVELALVEADGPATTWVSNEAVHAMSARLRARLRAPKP